MSSIHSQLNPEYDAVTLKDRGLPDFERDQIIAEHTSALVYTHFKELDFEWLPNQYNPRLVALTDYLNNMFEAVCRRELFTYEEISSFHDLHSNFENSSPMSTFSLTALGALTYATFVIRREDPGPLANFVCSPIEDVALAA